MFRTRDFILIFTTVTFLGLSIGATLWKQSLSETMSGEAIKFAEVGDQEYTAEVYVPKEESREERLIEMRNKIAESGKLSLSAPVTVTNESAETFDTDETEVTAVSVIQKCPGYAEYSGEWPRSGVEFEVVEGARIVYQNSPSVVILPNSVSSTSQAQPTVPERKILVQLPIHSFPISGTVCLSSDVVGIAQDGSLIRNNEAGLYAVFGDNTLIGYALDGFPIYGTSDIVGNECGGRAVNGQYGYYLSNERDVILNCFSATPVPL